MFNEYCLMKRQKCCKKIFTEQDTMKISNGKLNGNKSERPEWFGL